MLDGISGFYVLVSLTQSSTAPTVPYEGFIDPGSLTTFSVATGVVWAMYNTFRILFRRNALPVLFFASLIVSFGGQFLASARPNYWWAYAFLNTFLLFCSTVGLQEAVVRIGETPSAGQQIEQSAAKPSFLESWFRRL
jgi:hypothetical protein